MKTYKKTCKKTQNMIITVVLTWLGKWMYNSATQFQVLGDSNLGSYYLKLKSSCRGFPYRISFKEKHAKKHNM
jgi:hypothetical protein